MPAYPKYVRETSRLAMELAHKLGVPYATNLTHNGLYVKPRHRRDPINTNKKVMVLKVRLKRADQIVFDEIIERKDFPTDHLVAKLALVI